MALQTTVINDCAELFEYALYLSDSRRVFVFEDSVAVVKQDMFVDEAEPGHFAH